MKSLVHPSRLCLPAGLIALVVGGLMGSVLIAFVGCIAAFGWVIAMVPNLHGATAPQSPVVVPQRAPVPQRPLLAGGLLDEPPGPAVPPPADIDPDTGELLGDRVCRIEEVLAGMERSIEQLGNLMGEQSKLMANGLFELRRRVDHLEPAPHQQVLPLREAS